MSPFGPVTSVPAGVATSAAGSIATGGAERAGRIDAAGHSLAAGQQELSRHPLDSDANASADRDADGWTGGGHADEAERAESPRAGASSEAASRPRLPDDPCGGTLDVIA